jgi:hypothetical protein
MGIIHEHLFQCVIITWHIDASNATDCMFKTAGGKTSPFLVLNTTNRMQYEYYKLGIVLGSHITHKLTLRYLLKGVLGHIGENCGVYRLFVCRLSHESERAQCEITLVACDHPARSAEGFTAGLQMISLYYVCS